METYVNRKALVIFGIALLALLLLASGLSRLILYTPASFSADSTEAALEGVVNLSNYGRASWLLILFGLIFLSFFLTREGRRLLLLFILGLLMLFICLYTARPSEQVAPTPTPTIAGTPIQLIQVTPLPVQPAMLLEDEELHISDWLVTALGILGALAVTGGIALTIWLFTRRKEDFSLPDLIAQQAQKTADELQGGGDFSDVITRCYAQMSLVLQEARGLERDTAMTPREFETVLIRLGFPDQPIQTLTRLFEQVRYGHLSPDDSNIQQALRSLNAIISYCQSS